MTTISNSTVSRRGVLAGVTALAAANVAAIAAGHPDAELLALRDELKTVRAAVKEVCARHSKQHNQWEIERPPQPDVCKWRPSDEHALGLAQSAWRDDGWLFGSTVDRLRQFAPERVDFEVLYGPDKELIRMNRVMRPNDLERAREIVEAYDAWLPLEEACGRKFGKDQWDEETNEAMDEQTDIEREIMETPARTLEGLKVKALAALVSIEMSDDDPSLDDDDDDNIEPETILRRLARAILKIQPLGSQPSGSSW